MEDGYRACSPGGRCGNDLLTSLSKYKTNGFINLTILLLEFWDSADPRCQFGGVKNFLVSSSNPLPVSSDTKNIQ
jgi:hypothetical protein